MARENMLQKSKWDILKAVSEGKNTAVEIAKSAKTSLPNATQQLRLMEAYGMVDLGREKKDSFGKPKILYSLKKPIAHVTLAKKGFADSFLVNPSLIQTLVLSVLFLKSQDDQVILLRYLLAHEELMENCSIAYLKTENEAIEILLLTENVNDIRAKYSSKTLDIGGKNVRVVAWTHTIQDITEGLERKDHYYESLMKTPFVLHDPKDQFKEVLK